MQDVAEERCVEEAVEAAKLRWNGAERAWNAIVFALARDAENGKSLAESGRIRAITLQGATSMDMPTITVVYEIERNKVVITQALFEEAKPRPPKQ